MKRVAVALALIAATGCDRSAPEPSAAAPAAEATEQSSAAAPAASAAAAPAVTPTQGGTDPCEGAAFAMPGSTVVATVDAEPIRADALGDDARAAEREALHRYCREVHRIRQTATQRAVEDTLLTAAARKDGVAPEVFVRTKLDAAVVRPDDAEIEAYFDANKTPDAPPFEQVRGQVEEAMVKERTQVAYDELMTSLRNEAQVAVTLPDVRPPAVDLAPAEHTATFGDPGATVHVVEFSDFECPYCARAASSVRALEQRFGDKVRVSYRHFPLSFHPAARPAAELTQCAQEQGKFWELHDEIFAATSGLSASTLETMASEVGLDMAKLDECMQSGRASQQVEADLARGREVGVAGTPAFYVNGRPFEGGASELAGAVEAALAGS